jgi:HD-GYP domain-containing protein (c-di-GMP phosphodiesterase class II)
VLRETTSRSLGGETAEIVHRLAQAAELGDATIGHQRRTSRLALAVARRLGLPTAARAQLARASLLHDIGKLSVPQAILAKPGPLTAAERRVAESHTTFGWHLLSGLGAPLLREAAEIALLHHENVDGSGYPLGLAGHEIPFGARVVRVCDAFDAMTSDRPYRPAGRVDQALEVLDRGRDRQFDGRVVDALAALVSRLEAARRAA